MTAGDSTAAPRVSVLMTVHNEERYVGTAVASILDQTFREFEFIVIDDGSSDSTAAVVSSFDDPRVVLVSRENRGQAQSLNDGLDLARGRYVARQDADDVSRPTRLERQVAFLERHPRVALVGTNYATIDDEGNEVATTDMFTHPDDLKVAQALVNQFAHGSVMMVRETVLGIGAYDTEIGVEDYDLFARLSHEHDIANLPEPLYLWRRNPAGITFSNQELRIAQAEAVRDREFDRLHARRNEYRVFSSFRPLSTRLSPVRYLERKSALFRDFAYVYNERGVRGRALAMLAAAATVAPWQRRNLRYAWRLARRPGRKAWEYEWL